MSENLTLKDPYAERRIFSVRIFTSIVIMLSLLSALAWRYFSLQILEHDVYRTQSERNRVQLQPIPPKRGLLYDRNGVLLAENVPSYSLSLVKEQLDDIDESIVLLQQLLDIDEEAVSKFKRRLNRRRPYEPVPLKFKLNETERAIIAVNRYRLPGVEVEAQLVRNYPLGELFAHAIGYVGRISERELTEIDPVNYSGTYEIGKIGLEKHYEDQLHGKVGYQNVETNARGRVLRVLERSNPEPGKDITLHLDAYVQQVAHEALGDERGSVVAIDPKTGGVLALVSTPSFDANLFVTGISSKDYNRLRDSLDLPLFNRALQGQYPPGSTVKPIFGLAGLEYGIVTPQTVVRDPGWYRLPNDDRFYRDWKRGGHAATMNLKDSIIQSCDVYFYDLAYKMGIDNIHEFSAQFGLGEASGIDSTHERSGLLPSRDWKRKMKRLAWYPGETLNVGIGQGYMLTTPLQLAVATAGLASRGTIFEPRLLQSMDGKAVTAPQRSGVTASEANWLFIEEAMKAVVHSLRGTARRIAKGAEFEMAGKTGTAQVIGIAQGAKYDSEQIAKRNRDHALFIGYAPYDDPQIAVAVIIENGEGGGSKAAPVARKVFDAYLLPRPEGALGYQAPATETVTEEPGDQP